MLKKFILFFAILLAATALAGGAYKWIDQKGVANYAQTPPSAQKTAPNTRIYAMNLGTEPAPPRTDQPDQPGQPNQPNQPNIQWKEQERQFQTRRTERERFELEQAELAYQRSQINKFACLLARMNADALESQRPVYSINELGEKAFIDEEQRTKDLELVRQQIRQTCPAPP